MAVKYKFTRNYLLAAGAVLVLGACSSNPLSPVMERFQDNDKKEHNVAAEDQRVPVLALENELVPDPELANKPFNMPPAYINASWPQPGGEADHALHHLQAPLALRRQWSLKTGASSKKRSPVLAPPVIADNRLFVANAQAEILAVDAASGRKIWKARMTPDVSEHHKFYQVWQRNKPEEIGFGGGVAYDGGRVFVTSGFGFIAALDAETGNLLWKSKTNAPVRNAPTAANGLVFAVTNTNEIVAFDQESGEEQWQYQSFEEQARFLSSTSPAVSEEVVVVPFSSGEVTALNIKNGRQLWSETIGRSSRINALSDLNDISGSPVIDRGIVYAVSHAGQMAAIEMRTGKVLWDQPISGLQTPWVVGDNVFVVSIENQLLSLDRETGKIIWVAQLPKYKNEKKKKKRILWTGPIMVGNNLMLTSSTGIIALISPETGEVSRSVRFDKDGSFIHPVVANEKVYILSRNGRLAAYN
ncbi:MAG: outer membrane protein assembly factor BamB family protein [bacterium]